MSKDQKNAAGDPKGYPLKVNGVELHVSHPSLPASAILILAVEHDAIAGKPEEYVLQGDKGQYKPGDIVDLREDSVFIAIPDKATPVAL